MRRLAAVLAMVVAAGCGGPDETASTGAALSCPPATCSGGPLTPGDLVCADGACECQWSCVPCGDGGSRNATAKVTAAGPRDFVYSQCR